MALHRLFRRKVTLLSGRLVKDKNGRYMGFFDEFPEITAEGENADEAKANLLEALKEVLEYRRYRARQAANENDECREKKSKPDFQLEIA